MSLLDGSGADSDALKLEPVVSVWRYGMTLPVSPVEGGCQCRAVRYQITAPPLGVYNCHCRDCQRSSGGTHTMSMPTPREHVVLLQGELVAYDKVADSGRVVRMIGCAHCGTKVW